MNNRALTRARFIASPYIIWAALFIIAPLIFVIYYSFTNASGAFTLDNIRMLTYHLAIGFFAHIRDKASPAYFFIFHIYVSK